MDNKKINMKFKGERELNLKSEVAWSIFGVLGAFVSVKNNKRYIVYIYNISLCSIYCIITIYTIYTVYIF